MQLVERHLVNYELDIVLLVGHLRLGKHQTVDEIHE